MNHWGRIRAAGKVNESRPLSEDTHRSDPISTSLLSHAIFIWSAELYKRFYRAHIET